MRDVLAVLLGVAACGTGSAASPSAPPAENHTHVPQGDMPELDPLTLDERAATAFAELALACVHREYPNKVAHVLRSEADALPPRKLTPAFYGCFDWHSAVHGHWLLARFARRFPNAEAASRARQALEQSLTKENIAREIAYVGAEGRAGFERPYGLAWLLQLSAELREWDDPDARRWAEAVSPLADVAAQRFEDWLPKLGHPIRTGEHSQTAFAMGLVLDWARTTKNAEMQALVEQRALDFHENDRDCALHLEPSGHDFLSPCLAAADLMRRVSTPAVFADWLGRALPGAAPQSGQWLRPAVPADRIDGKLVHLDGLNLSRAWMLEGVVCGLPIADSRRTTLLEMARAHRAAGLSAISGAHYSGAHWLGSFAMYLATRRGITSDTSC